MSSKLERFGLGLLLGPITPLIAFLGLWWSTYSASLPEKWIAVGALAGLALGILADVIFLKRWVNQASQFGFKFWIALYLFYSMGVFGFFMGVPVFNLFLAIPAGFIVATKLTAQTADPQRVQRTTRLTAWLTTGIMLAICFASATLALSDPYTSANLEGMLGLNFELTREMLVALIGIGGAILLACNWWLTASAVRFSNLLLHRKAA
jgi:hypothetical protein